jgi:hypothetical protein
MGPVNRAEAAFVVRVAALIFEEGMDHHLTGVFDGVDDDDVIITAISIFGQENMTPAQCDALTEYLEGTR